MYSLALTESCCPAQADEELHDTSVGDDPRDPAQIQYTSGTTGFPKGVVLHHHGVANNARHSFARMDFPQGATSLIVMPLFHTAGCALAILGGVQSGSRMILARQFDPDACNALIESQGVAGMMLGYNDDPEATVETVDAQGWLHTGDLGTMDKRGFVKITGRVKDMIIRGGENLFPAEIENVLLEHSDVAEVAVVGVPDARMGEAVAAFVRTTAGASFDPQALITHCRANIAAQKAPTHWIEVSEWPLTGSGKIQKFVLRDRWVAGEYTF